MLKYNFVTLTFDTSISPNLFSRNSAFFDNEKLYTAEKKMKFKIPDNNITKIHEKYLIAHHKLLEEFGSDRVADYAFQYYIDCTEEDILSAKKHMNETIDEINKFKIIKIAEDLKLDPSSNFIDQEKINALHKKFEIASTLPEYQSNTEFNSLAWQINNACHTIEKQTLDTQKWFMTFYLNFSRYFKLPRSDYELFTPSKPGNIYLSHSTAGKTLYDCYITDDLELIKSGSLRQEYEIGTVYYLNNSLLLSYNPNDPNYEVEQSENMENYYKWLKDNKVGEIIDLDDPIYNPNMPLLAEIIEPNFTEGSFKNFWDKNYWLSGIFFTKD